MGKIVLKKGTIECDIHNDLYALHQNYGEVENNSAYWDELLEEIVKIAKKYRGTDMQRFSEATLIAFADYLNAKATGSKCDAKAVANIVCCGRTKEEIGQIIKEMGVKK